MEKFYTVTELAKTLGITPRALRFYENKGLIAPERAGNTRIYTRRDRGRLILILRGKRLGFSLREIGEWLDLYDTDPSQREQMRVLLDKTRARIAALEIQLEDVRATLAELRQIETEVVQQLSGGAPAGRPAETAAAAPKS